MCISLNRHHLCWNIKSTSWSSWRFKNFSLVYKLGSSLYVLTGLQRNTLLCHSKPNQPVTPFLQQLVTPMNMTTMTPKSIHCCVSHTISTAWSIFLQQRCWCPRKDGQVRVHDRGGNGGTCWIMLVAFTKTLVIIFNAYAGLAWPGEQSKSSRYWTIPHALHFSSRFCFRDRVSLEVFQGKVAFSEPSLRALQDWLNSQLTKFLSKILRVGSNGVILRKTVDQHR